MSSTKIILLLLVSLLLQLDSAFAIKTFKLKKTSNARVRNALSASASGELTNPNSYYTVPITLGFQSFNVLIDTGKSDFWVVDRFCPDIFCVMRDRAFYQSSNSDTFSNKGQSVSVSYFYKGYQVSGITGQETFKMGTGESLVGQDFIRATRALQFTNEEYDGIMGLAYTPNIKPNTRLSVFENMQVKGQVDNRIFSLKITLYDGNLILGGTDTTLYNSRFKFKFF